MKNQIEIEFRSRVTPAQFRKLERFLKAHARDLGRDDKDAFFFIMPGNLLKVENKISKKNAAVVLKLNKIGKGSHFPELEFPIEQKYFNQATHLFFSLGITKNIKRSFQRRHNYRYKGVDIAMKYSKTWGYHVELEVVVDRKAKKFLAVRKIEAIADELGFRLMSDRELRRFTKKAEHRKGIRSNKHT